MQKGEDGWAEAAKVMMGRKLSGVEAYYFFRSPAVCSVDLAERLQQWAMADAQSRDRG